MSLEKSPVRIVVSDFQPLRTAADGVVAILVEPPPLAQRVARAMQALGHKLVMCKDVDDAKQCAVQQKVSLFVYQPHNAVDPQALTNARSLSESAPLILLVGSPEYQWFTEVLGQVTEKQSIASVIGAWADSDLLRTARKILEKNAFGVEKYLNWGSAVHAHRIHKSADKLAVLEQFAVFLRELRCPDSLVMRALTVADEYLMNAFFDAPKDAQGRYMYADRARTEAIDLGESKAVVLEYGSDGQNIVFGCRDLFGSFDVQKGMRSLGRCFKGDEDQIAHGPGGAGLGLYVAYHYVDHLVINLAPGDSTEFLAVMRMGAPSPAQRGKSVNLFISSEPHPSPR